MGCQERGGGEFFRKRKSLQAWVAKKRGGKIEPNKIIESMGCQEGKGVEKDIIESMGCQERGGGGEKIFIKRKSLKARVAKKGGGGGEGGGKKF